MLKYKNFNIYKLAAAYHRMRAHGHKPGLRPGSGRLGQRLAYSLREAIQENLELLGLQSRFDI